MRRRRYLIAGLVGAALAVGGIAPALAYHYDPVLKRWVIDCSSAPAYDPNKQVSVPQFGGMGWQPHGGDQYRGQYMVGVQSADPYVIVFVDPTRRQAKAAVWQPWYGEDEMAAGHVKPPFFIDQSVTVDQSGVHRCDTSIYPKTDPPLPVSPLDPRIPKDVPPRTSRAASVSPAR